MLAVTKPLPGLALVAFIAATALLFPSVARAQHDHQILVRTGFAASRGPLTASGPAIGLGYRVETTSIVLDLGLQLEMHRAAGTDEAEPAGAYPRGLVGLPIHLGDFLLVPSAGLGLGSAVAFNRVPETRAWSAVGLQLEAALGFFGHGPGGLRWGVELQGRVPLFRVEINYQDEPVFAPTGAAFAVVGIGRERAAAALPTVSYSLEILATDAANLGVIALLVLGKADDLGDATLAAVLAPLALYLAAAPLVHLSHDRPAAAWRSLRWRLGLPIASAFLGGILFPDASDLSSDAEFFIGAIYGLPFGVLGAIIFDAAVIARPTPGGAVAAVAKNF